MGTSFKGTKTKMITTTIIKTEVTQMTMGMITNLNNKNSNSNDNNNNKMQRFKQYY